MFGQAVGLSGMWAVVEACGRLSVVRESRVGQWGAEESYVGKWGQRNPTWGHGGIESYAGIGKMVRESYVSSCEPPGTVWAVWVEIGLYVGIWKMVRESYVGFWKLLNLSGKIGFLGYVGFRNHIHKSYVGNRNLRGNLEDGSRILRGDMGA